ncbi:MAG: hypothetical protein KGL42_17405, partial [Betaproteobacteria bacterium]|nr:hypothetical protein [Betaproteobacteria bacterium]
MTISDSGLGGSGGFGRYGCVEVDRGHRQLSLRLHHMLHASLRRTDWNFMSSFFGLIDMVW